MAILINSQNEEWAIRMIISAGMLSNNHKHSLSFTCLQINNKTYNKQMSKIGKCRRGVRWQYLNINMCARLINKMCESGRKFKMSRSVRYSDLDPDTWIYSLDATLPTKLMSIKLRMFRRSLVSSLWKRDFKALTYSELVTVRAQLSAPLKGS